jgi:hypothetical protein
VTLTVAGAFANNDIIFINNAGQDYYTRIVSGGGTTTLTVSPAVSYDASATVTKYTAQNIGATSNDYTTQSNRFFQGYFLGGVVAGAGSTTLSDGNLTSTNGLTLQTAGGVNIQNTSDSASALTVKTSTGTDIIKVNSTSQYVGINTSNPQAPLHVAASSSFFQDFETGTIAPFTGTCAASTGDSYTGSYSAYIYGACSSMTTQSMTFSSASTISFYWVRYGSNASLFYIDGAYQGQRISADGGWAKATFAVSAGTHTFTWVSQPVGNGYVDDVYVEGITSNATVASFGGKVGVNTTNPSSFLDIIGAQPASSTGNGTAATATALLQGGAGGNTTGTTGQVAGAGSGMSFIAGNGGTAPSGSTNGNGGSILLSAGAAGAGVGTAGMAGQVIVKNVSNSTNAFQIQNTAGASLLTADTANNRVLLVAQLDKHIHLSITTARCMFGVAVRLHHCVLAVRN